MPQCISVRTFLLGFRNSHDMWAAFEVHQSFIWRYKTTVFRMSYSRSDATDFFKKAFQTLNHNVEKLFGFGVVRGNEQVIINES